MKKCPYCAEEIQDEAIVCRYCGRDLVEKPKPQYKYAIWKTGLFIGFFWAALTAAAQSALKKSIADIYGGAVPNIIFFSLISSIMVGLVRLIWPRGERSSVWRELGRAVLSYSLALLGVFLVFAILLGGSLARMFPELTAASPMAPSVAQVSTQMGSQAQPTATKRILPTKQPLAIRIFTPTSPIDNLIAQGCVDWRKITSKDVGKKMCVYGYISSIVDNSFYYDPETHMLETTPYKQQIILGDGNRCFLIMAYLHGYKSSLDRNIAGTATAKGTPLVSSDLRHLENNKCVGVYGTIGTFHCQYSVDVESATDLFYCTRTPWGQ